MKLGEFLGRVSSINKIICYENTFVNNSGGVDSKWIHTGIPSSIILQAYADREVVFISAVATHALHIVISAEKKED